jgi:Tol biopolymer transport system component
LRVRSGVLAVTLAATALLAPFAASTAHAVTTTSTLVAYVAATDATGDTTGVYTRAADGSGAASLLFSTTEWVNDIALSPDGTKLAYTLMDPVPAEMPTVLYVRSATDPSDTPTLLAGADSSAPAWSSDGTTIVFERFDVANDDLGIATVPADGSAAATFLPGSDFLFAPSFSPSGRQLVATALDFATGASHLVVVTPSGASSTVATVAGAADGYDARWSPDGAKIVFTKDFGCGGALYSLPAGGGVATAVRERAGYVATMPAFSRDGSQLFWNEFAQSCDFVVSQSDIYVGAADGAGAAPVVVTDLVDEYGATVGGGPAPAADTTAPAAAVVEAAGTVSATTATIGWTADPDASEFVVVRAAHGALPPATPADGVLVYDGSAHAATAAGLVTGTVYDLYVFALDARGNAAPASAAHAVKPIATPAVNAIGLVSSLSTTAKFPVAWTGAAGQYQVSYGEKTRASNGTWSAQPVYKTWSLAPAATSATFTGSPGHSYYFQARGLDGFGNTTAPSAARQANVPLNDNYAGMAYSAGWTTGSSPTRYLTTLRSHTVKNASMTFKTETSSFTVVGDKCASCGQVQVWIDGVLKATVDTKAATTQVRQVLYAGAALAGGVKSHTVKLVVVGTAGRPKVNVDGLGLTR